MARRRKNNFNKRDFVNYKVVQENPILLLLKIKDKDSNRNLPKGLNKISAPKSSLRET